MKKDIKWWIEKSNFNIFIKHCKNTFCYRFTVDSEYGRATKVYRKCGWCKEPIPDEIIFQALLLRGELK